MHHLALPLSGGLLLCIPASAQNFNIDIGDLGAANGAGSPSASYGAAAGSPGTWHHIDVGPLAGLGNYTSPPLTDTSGGATGVTVDFDVVNAGDTFTTLDADEPNTMGDDALLMDDIMYCVGSPFTVTFNGLAPGVYDVYTYAMAPDSATLFCDVDVPLGTGGVQNVGGAGQRRHSSGTPSWFWSLEAPTKMSLRSRMPLPLQSSRGPSYSRRKAAKSSRSTSASPSKSIRSHPGPKVRPTQAMKS